MISRVHAKAVVDEARDLRTEDESNPEYDRALVELTMRLLGADEDQRGAVERLILGDRS